MSPAASRRIAPVLGLVLAAGVLAAVATGGDAPASAPPTAIGHPFLKSLVGEWDTETTEGLAAPGRGRATWRLAVGDTALVQEFSGTAKGPDGKEAKSNLLAVVREPGPSKMEAWLFDARSPTPLHFTGALTETGFDVAAESPDGRVRLTCETKGETREFRMWLGDKLVAVKVYRPSLG